MRTIDHVLVEFFVCLDHCRYVEIFFCTPRGCPPQRSPSFLVSQERCHGVGEALNVSRLHDKTFLSTFEEVRYATRSGAHDRQTRGHCLHDRERVALPVRAQDENIHCAEYIWNIGPQSEEVDLAGQTEVLSLFFQLFPQDALSNQDQMGLRIGSGALGERFQEQDVIFLWGKTRHADKENIIVAEALPCPPLAPWGFWRGVAIRRNTVRDHPALLNPIKAS